ncbi:MAG TPA: AAA domain-containing protein [Flavihumibacter sp.]
MDYFRRLAELLKIEWKEDKESFDRLTHNSSVQERRANGYSWYPVAIRDQELGKGDYLTVQFERTTHTDIVHFFRFGVAATLFSQHAPRENRLEGIVTHVSGNTLKINFRVDELPEWTDDGKLGIDLAFDDNSYEEMRKALQLADALQDKREEGELIRILTGRQAPEWKGEAPAMAIPGLNPSQQAAVQNILRATHLAIVHGPPGTGKTTTLVKAIQAIYQEDEQPVLVVAASNAAVDLLSEKLSLAGMEVLRIGNPARVSDTLQRLTLDEKLSNHPRNKDIKRMKKQADEYRSMAHKYKRSFGKAEWEQRKALFKEARSIMQEVDNTLQYMTRDIIDRAQVITATLVGAAHYTIQHLRYKTVVMDEATQALEPAAWIPILKGKKLVLAGDHHQLSPTVKSQEAASAGLSTSLFEKLVNRYPDSVSMLTEQYRMNEAIMEFSNSEFYDGRLVAAPAVRVHVIFGSDSPFLFIDTAGCGFEEKQVGTSTCNPEEAAFLIKQLGAYGEEILRQTSASDTNSRIENLSLGIIAPYKEQVEALKSAMENAELPFHPQQISINTVDSFQGQERDIIYISLTRSNIDNRIGFLSEIRRMNVAMTRARKKLVVIGDSSTLAQHGFYARLIELAEKKGAYRSAWEWI